MSARAKKKGIVKQMIDEALGKVDNSGFPDDPTLDDNELTGPERFAKGQQKKDEVLIDSQLSDIAGKEGYFLKLKKELRPGLGEWMLMKTIENEWRQWADTETEVRKIVIEHTKTAPQKWGTGPYQIEYACKGGIRGKQYPVRNFWINAEEEFLNPHTVGGVGAGAIVNPEVAVASRIEELSKLVEMLSGVMPKPPDPSKTQEQIATAFTQGMQLKVGEGSSNNTMMTALITGLMGMMTAVMTGKKEEPRVVNPKEELTGVLEVMKTFGVLGSQQPVEKPKTFTETLAELKSIGIDIFKKDDPMEQMGKLKQFASIASDLMGIGGTAERPSVLEKVVDMLGPAIPGMIKDLRDTAGNVATAQVEAGKNIERAKIAAPVSQPVVPSNEGTQMNMAPNAAPVTNPQVVAFFNGLHDATRMNNRLYYPIVYASLVSDPQGIALIDGIVKETHTAKELIELLQGYGDVRFKDSEFVVKHLVGYTNGFIIWLRDMVRPKAYVDMAQAQANTAPVAPDRIVPVAAVVNGHNVSKFEIQCPVCNIIYVLDTPEEFNEEENKVCGNNGCVGALRPLSKV
jgi:hypothetical protein